MLGYIMRDFTDLILLSLRVVHMIDCQIWQVMVLVLDFDFHHRGRLSSAEQVVCTCTQMG